MSVDESLSRVNWKGATYEGVKTTAISIFLPSGAGTAKKVHSVGKTKIGKVLASAIVASTEEISKRYAAGDYSNSDGSINWDKLNGDEFQNILTYGFISALFDGGFNKKAKKLLKKISSGNDDYIKHLQKLEKHLSKKDVNPNLQKTVERRVKKASDAYKDKVVGQVQKEGLKVVKESSKKAAEQSNDKVIKD